mgnify:CR=1 FL=1
MSSVTKLVIVGWVLYTDDIGVFKGCETLMGCGVRGKRCGTVDGLVICVDGILDLGNTD